MNAFGSGLTVMLGRKKMSDSELEKYHPRHSLLSALRGRRDQRIVPRVYFSRLFIFSSSAEFTEARGVLLRSASLSTQT